LNGVKEVPQRAPIIRLLSDHGGVDPPRANRDCREPLHDCEILAPSPVKIQLANFDNKNLLPGYKGARGRLSNAIRLESLVVLQPTDSRQSVVRMEKQNLVFDHLQLNKLAADRFLQLGIHCAFDYIIIRYCRMAKTSAQARDGEVQRTAICGDVACTRRCQLLNTKHQQRCRTNIAMGRSSHLAIPNLILSD